MRLGKVSEPILKRSVLKYLKSNNESIRKGAAVGADCAFYHKTEKEIAVATASVSGEKGDLPAVHAILRATNNLAAGGAIPFGIQLHIMLPERYREIALKRMMEAAADIAAKLQLTISGGHTEVLPDIQTAIVSATALGYVTEAEIDHTNFLKPDALIGEKTDLPGQESILPGQKTDLSDQESILPGQKADLSDRESILPGQKTDLSDQESILPGQKADLSDRESILVGQKTVTHVREMIKPGQEIVMTKWIGISETARLAREKEEELLSRYPAYFIKSAQSMEQYYSVVPEAVTVGMYGVSMMHDVAGGGIFGALWELGEKAGVGLQVQLKKIPIKQETVEICEFFGYNPYEIRSDGALLFISDEGHLLVEKLAGEGISAAVIGITTNNNDKIIVNEDEKRFLEPPRP